MLKGSISSQVILADLNSHSKSAQSAGFSSFLLFFLACYIGYFSNCVLGGRQLPPMNYLKLNFIILFAGLLTVFSVYMPIAAYAQDAAVIPPKAPMSEQSFFGNTLMFMVAGFLGYYMLVTRPQQLQEQEQKTLAENIKKNDTVLISPGIFGKVIQTLEGEVTVDIGTSGSTLKVKVLPSAISLPVAKVSDKSLAKN